MSPSFSSRVRFALLGVALLAVATVPLQACARSVNDDFDGSPALFSPDAKNPASLGVCVQTVCPAPWATCPDTSGLCTVDTSRDIDHCGSCSTACPTHEKSYHETGVCTKGVCSYACDELYADCNKVATDGCEVFTGDDPKNCGACGNVCDDGVLCWRGACGCPSGLTQCGDDCKDLTSDVLNCSACGQMCVAPKSSDPAWKCGADVEPPNTVWGCADSSCKQICKPPYGDCNNNFCGDGCEVDQSSDRNNCGACGHACDPGQDCVDSACICPSGTTRCGNDCVDIGVDPYNCGSCGNECPGPGGGFPGHAQNGSPTCNNGECGYQCYAGFADCDKHIFNGCEVPTGSDPRNCGGCGITCDVSQGQPCVEGQCLTKKCDPPAVLY